MSVINLVVLSTAFPEPKALYRFQYPCPLSPLSPSAESPHPALHASLLPSDPLANFAVGIEKVRSKFVKINKSFLRVFHVHQQFEQVG